jgi:hypothetical protein
MKKFNVIAIFFMLLGFCNLSFAFEPGAAPSATGSAAPDTAEFVGEEAEPWVQEMGQWAQEAVGVPVRKRTRIYRGNESEANAYYNALSNRIYVCPSFYRRPDLQKFTLLHEAVHLKNHDFGCIGSPSHGQFAAGAACMGLASSLLTFTGGCLNRITYDDIPISKKQLVGLSGKVGIETGLCIFVSMELIFPLINRILATCNYFFERRADTEGIRALKCYICALQVARTRCVEPELCKKGYLSQAELFDLAQKQHDLRCHEHEEHATSKAENFLRSLVRK